MICKNAGDSHLGMGAACGEQQQDEGNHEMAATIQFSSPEV
ncbi:hypothetical protein RMSM_01400 [Rhodopirellula maiorica SM1]|uniref:Uncharacterized protein n=1 Tax=Rhodopirellula maiorica SM1 TaxID=1265738 RepID=M5S654_9BACT|nr:hypothetical protein RMSM_01400 [Rhodopirellula maiorica SM1]